MPHITTPLVVDRVPPLMPRWWLPTLAGATVAVFGTVFYWRPWWVIYNAIRAWLLAAGARSRYVQLGAFRIHYYVGGRGRPVVLVHGLGARAESVAGIMTALMRHGHRVYAVDLLGFGRSDQPDVDYSIALQAQMLKQFVDHEGLSSFDLGGWSMGGWIALKMALEYPQCIRRLFLIDSAGVTFKVPFEPSIFQPETLQEARRFLTLLTPFAAYIPDFVARDLIRQMRPARWVVQRALKSMMGGSELLDGKLGTIRVPVFIAWGKQDALIPLSCGEQMHREMPYSQLAIFSGCGHMMPTEKSGSLVLETVRFLAADPPLPPGIREVPE